MKNGDKDSAAGSFHLLTEDEEVQARMEYPSYEEPWQAGIDIIPYYCKYTVRHTVANMTAARQPLKSIWFDRHTAHTTPTDHRCHPKRCRIPVAN